MIVRDRVAGPRIRRRRWRMKANRRLEQTQRIASTASEASRQCLRLGNYKGTALHLTPSAAMAVGVYVPGIMIISAIRRRRGIRREGIALRAVRVSGGDLCRRQKHRPSRQARILRNRATILRLRRRNRTFSVERFYHQTAAAGRRGCGLPVAISAAGRNTDRAGRRDRRPLRRFVPAAMRKISD